MNKLNVYGNKGQSLLIFIFILSVILVVGLSVVSRTVSDIKVSQQTQESARALWVAQSGLEEAEASGQNTVSGQLGGVSYVVERLELGNTKEFVFPNKVAKDEPLSLWLVGHDDQGNMNSNFYTGNLAFYWGEPGTANNQDETPAIEGTLVYKKSGKYYTKRWVYDPNSGRVNDFDKNVILGCSLGGENFAFCTNSFGLPAGGEYYFLRIKLLYNSSLHKVGVKGTSDLPSQGGCLQSKAVATESGVTRKLEKCETWDTVPEIFDYGIFGTIEQ